MPTIQLKERNSFNRREDYALLHLPCTIISPCQRGAGHISDYIFLSENFIQKRYSILEDEPDLSWFLDINGNVTSLNYSQGHVKPVLHYRYKTLLFLSDRPTPAPTRGQGQ